MNQSYFQSADVVRVSIIRHELPQASAGQRARKRISFHRMVGGVFACIVMATLCNIMLINFLFFPECNRITNDCFLVQHLWGAK